MDDIIYIQKCLKLIEHKLGWRDRSAWVYEDFRRLQEMILEASGTSLSVHTLERLFGKLKTHKNYNPQKETKNALAVFLGYEDWKDFQASNPVPTQRSGHFENVSSVPEAQSERGSKFSLKKKVALVVVFCFVTFSGYFILNSYQQPGNKIMPVVDLEASNLYGVRPHTVKFTFDIAAVDAKDISIDFGTGKPLHNLSKKQDHLFKTYLKPGIYDVQLRGDGKLLASTPVFIDMKGWKASAYSKYEDVETRRSIPDSIVSGDGRLYTPPHLLSNLVEPNMHYFVEYLKVKDFKVEGDNMTFETRFKNDHRFNYQICYDMWFKLIGTDGVLKMHFLKSGCAGFVQMIFGEKNLNGHKQDLSAFTKEFHDWKTATMKVKDKQVSLYFEDELIYNTSYNKSVGKILAIAITSKGSGQTDYVKLYNKQQELVYSEDF